MAEALNMQKHPPVWRVIFGFVLAPAIGAVIAAILLPTRFGIIIDSAIFGIVAYPVFLIIGIPAYFYLRKYYSPTLLNCMIIAGLIVALSWLYFALEPILDGRPNEVRWHEIPKMVFLIVLAGSAAGAAFWVIALAGHRHQDEND